MVANGRVMLTHFTEKVASLLEVPAAGSASHDVARGYTQEDPGGALLRLVKMKVVVHEDSAASIILSQRIWHY